MRIVIYDNKGKEVYNEKLAKRSTIQIKNTKCCNIFSIFLTNKHISFFARNTSEGDIQQHYVMIGNKPFKEGIYDRF